MGSPFASQSTSDPIPLPFDPPQWAQVRRLTGREVEHAQQVHLASLVSGRSARGWSAAFQRIVAGVATQQDAEQALADPLAGYDRIAIVRAGLVAWSYSQPIKCTPSDRVDGKVDAIEDLVDEALEFLAREILKLTKPALFQTQEEAKATQREAHAVPSFAER